VLQAPAKGLFFDEERMGGPGGFPDTGRQEAPPKVYRLFTLPRKIVSDQSLLLLSARFWFLLVGGWSLILRSRSVE
jgi:hypothetical protein